MSRDWRNFGNFNRIAMIDQCSVVSKNIIKSERVVGVLTLGNVFSAEKDIINYTKIEDNVFNMQNAFSPFKM